MKKLLMVLMLLILPLSISAASIALAEQPQLGGCPDLFHLESFHEHDQEHEGHHRHIGLHLDRNQDGFICVKDISPEVHLHIDNDVPLE